MYVFNTELLILANIYTEIKIALFSNEVYKIRQNSRILNTKIVTR
jgi:hypothetical protein